MALETKRKIKDLTDNVLPGRVKEIEEICGAPIPYEVDWASFGSATTWKRSISSTISPATASTWRCA
jgi:hypothetical protein